VKHASATKTSTTRWAKRLLRRVYANQNEKPKIRKRTRTTVPVMMKSLCRDAFTETKTGNRIAPVHVRVRNDCDDKRVFVEHDDPTRYFARVVNFARASVPETAYTRSPKLHWKLLQDTGERSIYRLSETKTQDDSSRSTSLQT